MVWLRNSNFEYCTLSVQYPQHHTTTRTIGQEKGKFVENFSQPFFLMCKQTECYWHHYAIRFCTLFLYFNVS